MTDLGFIIILARPQCPILFRRMFGEPGSWWTTDVSQTIVYKDLDLAERNLDPIMETIEDKFKSSIKIRRLSILDLQSVRDLNERVSFEALDPKDFFFLKNELFMKIYSNKGFNAVRMDGEAPGYLVTIIPSTPVYPSDVSLA